MDEYRRRLEILTGEKDIWEEYNPVEEEAIPERTNPNSPQVGAENPKTQSTSVDSRSVPYDEYFKSATQSTLAIRPAGTPPPQRRPQETELKSHTTANVEQKVAWPDYGLKKGEVSPQSEAFCPWKLVTRYPNTFVGKRNGVRAAPFFEAPAIHEGQDWDFFYIHNPLELEHKPILFVPTYQFQHLLEVVNAELDTNLTIPDGKNTEKFTMTFGHEQTPRPRFLGRSTTHQTFEALETDLPLSDPTDSLDGAPVKAKEYFLEQLETIRRTASMGKNKSEKNRVHRIAAHKAWGRSIRRVQRYLGLRKTMSSREDVASPATIKPEGSAVFISIDLEAYEHNQDIITEVGMAILDTLETEKTPPGDGGENWLPLIRARHIRIKENAWARNRRYVKGCETMFNFGKSEFVKCDRVASLIGSIIEASSTTESGAGQVKRPVIFVFHDSSQDVRYLQVLGFDIHDIENFAEVVDTRNMHQYIQRARNPAKLETVLTGLGLLYRNLHNAGNDAVFTMQAMVGLAIKKHQARLDDAGTAKKDPQSTLSELLEDEGWSSSSGQSDEGNEVAPLGSCQDSDLKENNSRASD